MPANRPPSPFERALEVTAANPRLGRQLQTIITHSDVLKGRAIRVAELLVDGGVQAATVIRLSGGRYVTGADFEDGVDWLDEVGATLAALLHEV